jgi:hypothetical protein
MMTGGVNPNLPAETRGKGQSPRSRGIKKGLFIFLLTFLIVPIIAILTVRNERRTLYGGDRVDPVSCRGIAADGVRNDVRVIG